jgi:hypothetical protein
MLEAMKNGNNHQSRTNTFKELFEKCCEKYNRLAMFVAWVGDPANNIPYAHLRLLDTINATVGISFSQSHPDGIEQFMKLDRNMRVMNEQPLFHPKVYIFSNGRERAMIIGSSNFTYSGFCENIEMNILLEGVDYQKIISEKEQELISWRDQNSFKPTKEWLKEYRRKYEKRQLKLQDVNVKDEATKEAEHAFASSWINKLNWAQYYQEIFDAIERKNYDQPSAEVLRQKVYRLEEYETHLALPWHLSYFDDLERRKMMWGIEPYAWLGHVGSSRQIMQILASGTNVQKRTIINAINTIGSLNVPVEWDVLLVQLKKLTAIGPTIKVWGRFLAITRPDLFCTFSSPTLISNLASTLEVTKSHLGTVDGYVDFLKIVHSSPWFNSTKPSNKLQAAVWEKRVAFLDEVLY